MKRLRPCSALFGIRRGIARGGSCFHVCKVLWIVCVAVCVPLGESGRAVIFLGTGNPDHNTSDPEGELAGSGWQFQGDWGEFLGTVIGERHFITALHVGGKLGERFHYRGAAYTAKACYRIGSVDLRVWEVCGRFPKPYAPLYSSNDEVGKELVVFGRGTVRGDAVRLETSNGDELRGWLPGRSDNRRRWGKNQVTDVLDLSQLGKDVLPGERQYLIVDFDREGGFNEGHLTAGDSGGAVFIRDAGQWALAGINHSVDGVFNTVPKGDGFSAALFDAGGFYHNAGKGDWVYLPDQEEDVPSAFYAIRISRYLAEIQAVLDGNAEPERREPWLVSSPTIDGRYQMEANQNLDESLQTIAVPLHGEMRFYRLQGCEEYGFHGLSVRNQTAVLRFRIK